MLQEHPGEGFRGGGGRGTRGIERSAQGWHSLNCISKEKEASGKRTVQKRNFVSRDLEMGLLACSGT